MTRVHAHCCSKAMHNYAFRTVHAASRHRAAMPQVLLKPGMDAIPRTQMRFDFDLERRLLAEDGGGASSNPCAPTFASAAKSVSPLSLWRHREEYCSSLPVQNLHHNLQTHSRPWTSVYAVNDRTMMTPSKQLLRASWQWAMRRMRSQWR